MKVSPFAKNMVLLNCVVPVTLLGWDAAMGQLGANPVNFAIHTTGMLALIFLLLSLTITPASRLTGWSGLAPFRRVMGLMAFFHACLHFLIFFWFDREGKVVGTLTEIIARPYLIVGMTGLLLMVPLAATSTNSMIKRLGGKRWKTLHRLAYVAAIVGVIHFGMQVKADFSQPIAFTIVLAILLGYRLVRYSIKLRPAKPSLRTVPEPR